MHEKFIEVDDDNRQRKELIIDLILNLKIYNMYIFKYHIDGG